MALTLIKEDGTSKADANSYATVADGNAYHDAHLYASAWTSATDAQKAVALVMASRLIDAHYQFNGTRTTDTQAMQWPRSQCPAPDYVRGPVSVLLPLPSDYVPFNSVPKAVQDATCETARALLIEDRTANPLGEGIAFTGLGGNQTKFDKKDRRPVIPYVAQAMLAKFGGLVMATSGSVRLKRV